MILSLVSLLCCAPALRITPPSSVLSEYWDWTDLSPLYTITSTQHTANNEVRAMAGPRLCLIVRMLIIMHGIQDIKELPSASAS